MSTQPSTVAVPLPHPIRVLWGGLVVSFLLALAFRVTVGLPLSIGFGLPFFFLALWIEKVYFSVEEKMLFSLVRDVFRAIGAFLLWFFLILFIEQDFHWYAGDVYYDQLGQAHGFIGMFWARQSIPPSLMLAIPVFVIVTIAAVRAANKKWGLGISLAVFLLLIAIFTAACPKSAAAMPGMIRKNLDDPLLAAMTSTPKTEASTQSTLSSLPLTRRFQPQSQLETQPPSSPQQVDALNQTEPTVTSTEQTAVEDVFPEEPVVPPYTDGNLEISILGCHQAKNRQLHCVGNVEWDGETGTPEAPTKKGRLLVFKMLEAFGDDGGQFKASTGKFGQEACFYYSLPPLPCGQWLQKGVKISFSFKIDDYDASDNVNLILHYTEPGGIAPANIKVPVLPAMDRPVS